MEPRLSKYVRNITGGKKGKGKPERKKVQADEVHQPIVEDPPPTTTEADEIVEEEYTKVAEDATREEQQEELIPTSPPVEIDEGPFLSSLSSDIIIETFEGEKVNGLFEGEGFMKFIDGHTYRGQFSKGLMHGYGCYKWVDGVTYEGNFDQNHISGKGLYTYPDGSSYEGDVVEGKRHGFGVYTVKDNAMSYSGEWHMGCKQGKGHLKYDSDGISFYDGDWVNDSAHGWGKRRYPNGNEYQGMWSNSKQNIDGSMKWSVPGCSKSSELYNGQWSEGVQHGVGEHIWMTYRGRGTHFDTRNSYTGQFSNGIKHGKGIFQYADGAKYDGEWYNDMKHGQVIFTKATGEIHTGEFVNNCLPPNAIVPGLPSFFSGEPCPSYDFKENVIEINFLLDVEELLRDYPYLNMKLELEKVSHNVLRHIGILRSIYTFYSHLGCEVSTDNVYLMSNLQYWRFLKDCQFHHYGYTLIEMDRIVNKPNSQTETHSPFTRILRREFFENLIILSFHFYHKRYMSKNKESKPTRCMLDWCFFQLLKTSIFPNAFKVKGYLFDESRKAITVFEHIDKVYPIYKSIRGQQSSSRVQSHSGSSFRMRDFLYLLKDMELINEDLTSEIIVKILALDYPAAMQDGYYNLELDMTFLEFIEALVGCAEVYVTESLVESESSFRQVTDCDQAAITQLRQQSIYSSSPMNGVVGTNPVSTEPAAITAESGWVMSGETDIKTHSSKTSSPQVSPIAASIPVIGSPELSTIGSAHLSDTKIIDLINIPEIHAALSRSRLEPGMVSPVEEYREPSSEVLGEIATKKYNFWKHQIHIFFIQKFIGPAQELFEIRRIARLKAAKDIQQATLREQEYAFRAEHLVNPPPTASTTPTENNNVDDEQTGEGIMQG